MCNCSDTKKHDDSDMGITHVCDSEWKENEQHFGSIFSMSELRAMDQCAKQIGAIQDNLFV